MSHGAGPSVVAGTTAAKMTFRALLDQRAGRLGLTLHAVELLVQRSQITYWKAGQRLYSSADGTDLVSFLVSGVAKVVCRAGRRAMVVQLLVPGRFVCLPPDGSTVPCHRVDVVAHVPSVVAITSRTALLEIIGTLPQGHVATVMSWSWRASSRLAYETSVLMMMPLRDRLIHRLRMLTELAGRPIAGGTVIDVPLTGNDLADLVAATRSNVSRCLAVLRREGMVERLGERIVVTGRLLAPERDRGALPAKGRRPASEAGRWARPDTALCGRMPSTVGATVGAG